MATVQAVWTEVAQASLTVLKALLFGLLAGGYLLALLVVGTAGLFLRLAGLLRAGLTPVRRRWACAFARDYVRWRRSVAEIGDI